MHLKNTLDMKCPSLFTIGHGLPTVFVIFLVCSSSGGGVPSAPSDTNCPASALLDVHTNFYHSYPSHMQDQFAQSSLAASKKVFCQAQTKSPADQLLNNYTCFADNPVLISSDYCPVKPQSLLDSTKASSAEWQSNATIKTLCYLNGAISGIVDPAVTINVFIFGGSATSGHYSLGCCCDPALDSQCPLALGDKSRSLQNQVRKSHLLRLA